MRKIWKDIYLKKIYNAEKDTQKMAQPHKALRKYHGITIE